MGVAGMAAAGGSAAGGDNAAGAGKACKAGADVICGATAPAGRKLGASALLPEANMIAAVTVAIDSPPKIHGSRSLSLCILRLSSLDLGCMMNINKN
jgi:hypothetical protein